MWLGDLRAENFRLLEPMSLRPHRRCNLVIGPNAAGKTSLLETIYTLGRGKSFRGHSPAELAGPSGRRWSLRGRIHRDESPGVNALVNWDAAGTHLSLEPGGEVSALDLVRALPVQILEPGMHRLLQDGPSYRRSFLDWGLFHVEQDFYPAWRRFQRALRQRNQALRTSASASAVRAWHAELAGAGTRLQELRAVHVTGLEARFRALVHELLGLDDAVLDLLPGWPRDRDYATALDAGLPRDQKMGTTVEGPHRAELRIRVDAHGARNRVSRGQQKLLIAALLVAQAERVGAATGSAPLLLVDDFAAELADAFQLRLAAVLGRYEGQVWITSFERNAALDTLPEAAMFHVEQGRISTL
jgi:DNA replication and repair protein RecF